MSTSIDTTYLNKYTMTDYSTLFGSLPKTNESSGSSLVGLASEFQSIRSGSYGKLLSAYYTKMQSNSASEAEETETKNCKLVGTNASSLKSAAQTLSGMDFSEATEEDSLNAIKDFVSSYNSVIDTADDVDNKSILRNAVWMTNITKESAGLLSEIGISIGEDNKLTLDETKWAEASATAKNSLLTGRQGFAEKMLYKANQLTNASSQKTSYTASAYQKNGDYTKVNAQSMYDDLF